MDVEQPGCLEQLMRVFFGMMLVITVLVVML